MVVVELGIMETSFSGSGRIRDDTRISGIWMHECMIGWNYSRIYKNQDSRHSGSRRIEFSQLSWEVPTENPYMGAIWGGLPREWGDIHPYSPQLPLESVSPPQQGGVWLGC